MNSGPDSTRKMVFPRSTDPRGSIAGLRALPQRQVTPVQPSTVELIAGKRSYEDLLAAVAHELRSPLAAIRYAVSLLDNQNVEPVARQQARTGIERQVGRMARLIDDLVEVSRIGSQRLCLQRERIDLRIVLQQAIETVQASLNKHHHRLTVELPVAPVWLHADPGRMEQVFVNLLVNAAKYTGTGGELRLSVRRANGQVIVCVRDSGIGIAPEVLPHVFDLFMQAGPPARHSEAGLGIGLALVRSFVEAHGGRVDAASAGLGRGSQFSVFLPIS